MEICGNVKEKVKKKKIFNKKQDMDPGFYDLTIYEKGFHKKSLEMMEFLEKAGKIENVGSLMKRMTLDILGKN